MAFSRRDFLSRVGAAGGYGAAFFAMQGIGIVPMKAEEPAAFQAEPGVGNGVSVVILGGGIAGLVAAYEMRKLGYRCTVLEARSRPGGRNWTVRGGDTVRFLDGTVQHCEWGAGNYQNFGPARLPSVHKAMLGYCRELGIPMEVEVNSTRSAHLQNDNVNGGQPMIQRQVLNDTRGHVAELLSKYMASANLDAEMTADDRQRMLDFLRYYGPLDKAGKYVGSDRAGYKKTAGAGEDVGVLSEPISMKTLLDGNFWEAIFYEETFDWQATMFQPVGGMDRIPYAFAKSLGDVVRFNAPVTEIRKTSKGVKVGYTEAGVPKQIEAEYCICALPLQLLKKIPNDFDAPHAKVIAECTYSHAFKIAWESRRFWEQEHNVYGGLEFVGQGLSPVWLPSAGFFSNRGVLVSGYTEADKAFEAMPMEAKLAASRLSVEKLHPGFGRELEKPVYVNWGQMEWNEGSWIGSYDASHVRHSNVRPPARLSSIPQYLMEGVTMGNPPYEALIQPDGPIVFAGDHVSHQVGWQEGAALSSLRAIRMINEQVKARKTS